MDKFEQLFSAKNDPFDPKSFQFMAKYSLLPQDDAPEHLAEDGKELFILLKRTMEKIRSTEDPSPPPPLY